MYNQDIHELLDHIQVEVVEISEQSKHGVVDKISVKNTLENLRSVLDYAAQDILRELRKHVSTRIPEKVYFPYGRKENHFRKSINRNLPGVADHLPEVHSLLLTIQPFRCGDSWLVDLCELTNDAKHNSLNKTNNIKTRTIRQAGLGIISGVAAGTEVEMRGNIVNGVLQDDVFIARDGTTTIKPVSGSTIITENNNIQFLGKSIEVAPFLTKCHANMSSFIEALESN